jgi:hypothetical protein
MKNSISALILVAFLFLTSCASFAERLHHEKEYQEAWCSRVEGQTEFPLKDSTRVDCLMNEYAVEFDFADKWAEAVGQARFYANMTGREPGVVLIMEDRERDFKYLLRLLKAIEDDPKHWRVWIMEPGGDL